jgi:hypothetical protein
MKMQDKPDDRATYGLLAGMATGGFTVALAFSASMLVSRPPLVSILGLGLLSFVMATIVYFFGLMLVGVPGWILLHWLKFRGPRAAALWGATATAMVTASWTFTNGGPFNFGVGQALLALNGALVGVVIQRIAYRLRPPRPSPVPPCGAPTP